MPAPVTGADEVTISTEFVFTRTELQPVLNAIRASLACGFVPLDSPNRLQEALATLIRNVDGHGSVAVRRSPAALLTPEYWQIVVTGLDEPTQMHLALVFRAGRP